MCCSTCWDGEKRSGQIGRQHAVPIVLLHPQREAVLGDAGVVHQNRHRTELLDGFGEGFLDGFGIGHIDGDGECLAAFRSNLAGQLFQLGYVASRQRHSRAGFRQRQCTRPSNAPARAGDESGSICHERRISIIVEPELTSWHTAICATSSTRSKRRKN